MHHGGTKQLVTEPNIPVSSATNDLNGTSSIDSRNLDINTETKSGYDSKMPVALAPPPVLNVDADNYMLRGGMDTRPRSFSFTNGSSSSTSRQSNTTTDNRAAKSPLDLDMFCVRETVSSLAAVTSSSPPATPGCARTLSYHTLLCTCYVKCCCMCDTLCPLDCHACLHAAFCVRFASNHLCQRNTDLLPPVTLSKDKVSPGFMYLH